MCLTVQYLHDVALVLTVHLQRHGRLIDIFWYPMLSADTYLSFSPEVTLPMPLHHGAYSVGASTDMLWAYINSKIPRNTVIGARCPANFGFLLVVHRVFFDNVVRDISIRINKDLEIVQLGRRIYCAVILAWGQDLDLKYPLPGGGT
jgi:hypothetical protein